MCLLPRTGTTYYPNPYHQGYPPYHQKTSKPKHEAPPKLRHPLKGAEDFSSWMNHLKLALFMYDIDCDGDFTYWDLVEGYLENWDPYFPIELHLREKTYLRAQAFVILTMERNCDDDAHRLIRNCTTAASKFQRLRENYENKLVADLGIVVSDVVKLTYKEEEGDIRSHIRTFDERWEKMTMTAGGNLKPEHQEFGEVIERLSNCEMAKKEYLLMTLPDTMKYNQLVREIRNRDNYTYGDVTANLRKYVPQLAWKKKGQRTFDGSNNPSRNYHPTTKN